MAKFKTLEEAQAAYDKLVAEGKSNTAKAVKSVTEAKDKEIEALKKKIVEAEQVAKDAIDKVNDPKPDYVKAKVGKSTYKVNFGVDGKTPEQVAGDADLLARLVKIGSGALTEIK